MACGPRVKRGVEGVGLELGSGARGRGRTRRAGPAWRRQGGGYAGLGQERNGPASWAAGKKRKEKGEEGKSWAGPKTREREKSFEIKIKQI